MYWWCGTLILLKELYPIIMITVIVVFRSTESISDKTWLNRIQDLSLKIHDEKIMESHPLNEGFILLTNSYKKPSTTTTTSKPARLSVNNRISISHNISSTTCKTIVMMATVNQTSSSIVNHSVGHLSRRLLNERSYDTDIDTTVKPTPREDEDEINNFLKIDNEELSKQLVNIGVTIDGSGDTTEPSSKTTTTTNEPTTSAAPEIILSGNSTFLITVDCTNASAILTDILNQFNKTFPCCYNVTHSENTLQCANPSNIEVRFTFFTDKNITILHNLFQTIANIVSRMGIELKSVDPCGTKETVLMKNVTSCYLIDLCRLCGINPRRGICLPENNVSKCECFANQNDPSISYMGEFCKIQKQESITPISSSWTPVIVGILSGIAGLFCTVTSCLLIMFVHRGYFQRRNNSNQ